MEAAELFGVSERASRRWRDRHRETGLSGLEDHRLHPSPRRAPTAEIERMLGLYRGLYRGFTVKHFQEQLGKRYGYTLGYTVTKLHLHRTGLVLAATKRSARRKKRPRRPMVGMLLHQSLPPDLIRGTPRCTLGCRGWRQIRPRGDPRRCHQRDLLGLPGGAGGHGIEPVRGARGGGAARPILLALYRPGSHYFLTPEAGGRVSRILLTQFGRALKRLGIEHIAAYSPQARGRSERASATLQDRLPRELKLAGIATIEAANRWLAETYIAEHNTAFAIAAEQEGSAFVTDKAATWHEILCIQEERIVDHDNTVKWQRLTLQLPPSRLRPHFVKATGRVHECRATPSRRFSDRTGWPTTTPRVPSFSPSCRPHDTLPSRPFCAGAAPAQNKNEADRSTSYENRTGLRASDSRVTPRALLQSVVGAINVSFIAVGHSGT